MHCSCLRPHLGANLVYLKKGAPQHPAGPARNHTFLPDRHIAHGGIGCIFGILLLLLGLLLHGCESGSLSAPGGSCELLQSLHAPQPLQGTINPQLHRKSMQALTST